MLIPGGLDIKEYKKEWNKQYREANKEKLRLNEKDRKYFHDNKDKINANRKEQITCSCGCVLTKNSLSRPRDRGIWKNKPWGYPGISRDKPMWCLSLDNPG